MEIKTKFIHSRQFHPKFGEIIFGKYKLISLPTGREGMLSSSWECLLTFEDSMREGERSSQPAVEAEYILYWLSLMLRMKIEPKGIQLNGVEVGFSREFKQHYNEYRIQIAELPNLKTFVNKLISLELDVMRQYVRACEVYNHALSLFGENNTLAFFLLCISIECISNKVIATEQTCENFITFILSNISEEKKKDCESDADWKVFLKEVYYNHRSGFTHGGKEVPEASVLADKLNRKYVKNEIEGKAVKTPGLKWFESIVSDVLINFLDKQPVVKSCSFDKLKDLSLEKGCVKVKFKKSMPAGSIVKTGDIELD